MAEKKTIELEVKTDSVKSLKTQLREAQQEVQTLSEKFGVTSKEAINAAKKAGELKDAIGDAKALTDAFNPDAKFNALTNSLSGVAAGFGAFEGALGLVGVEGEAVEKTLLKVQSAMAISQGLQQLGEAKDSFKQLGAVAKSVFSGIKGAIAATGIGLLIVALGTIYTYWDDIKGAITGVNEEQKKATEELHKATLLEQKKLDSLDKQDNILKLQGKTEREILKLKIAQTDEVIKKSEVELENAIQTHKAQVEAEKKNKQMLKSAIEFAEKPLLMILRTVDKIGAFMGKKWTLAEDLKEWGANLVFDPKETKYEGYLVEKEMRENLEKLKNNRAGYELQIQQIDKDSKEKQKANSKELSDVNYQNYLKELEMKKAEEMSFDDFLNEEQKKKIDEEKTLKDAAKQQELADEAAHSEALIKSWEFEASENLRIEKEKEAAKKLLRQQEVQFVSDGFKAIGDFTELMGKRTEKERRRAFKIKKAADLASATIDGTKAVLSTYADTPGGPIIKGVAAGIAGVFSAIQIAKISKQQFDGGGSMTNSNINVPSGGGSNSNTTQSVIAPKFNIGGNSTNQLNTLQQQPIQAYVVSGEVTSAQALDRNKIKNATF